MYKELEPFNIKKKSEKKKEFYLLCSSCAAPSGLEAAASGRGP